MKAIRAAWVAACLFWLISSKIGYGQFYAPDTEFHDPVQRVYVVEAARVLGALARLEGTNFSEITYQLTTRSDTTSWEIHWLDDAGKTAKSAVVSYALTNLDSGPDFYRSAMSQLWQAGWTGLHPLEAEGAKRQFWLGAGEIGLAREESLVTAMNLFPKDMASDENWMPRLAGLLSHAALPSVSDRLTLDSMLLARGAAWLALTEQASAATFDDLWAPILFQAGRATAAQQLWGKAHTAKSETSTGIEAGWNIWLRKPTSKEVYLFATEPTNLPIAMPMLAYDVAVNESGRLLAELIPSLVSQNDNVHLHNYAPLFALRTTVGGGHLLNGLWSVYSRKAWAHMLAMYKPAPGEYDGYKDELAKLIGSLNGLPKINSQEDSSLIGFEDFVPLARLGRKEGVGKLVPTAVVSSRDLLNYGWEMIGLQMGSRYGFVESRWGVPEQAEPIFRRVTDSIDGLMPFFKQESKANISDYRESLLRLQLVDGLFHLVGWNSPPYNPDGSPLESSRLFVKRAWLRPRDFEWQARALWDADARADIMDLADTLHEKGGDFATVEILRYLDLLTDGNRAKIPHADVMRYAFAETLPEPTALYVRAIYNKKLQHLQYFQRGVEVEKMYWQNPDSGLEPRVFRDYAFAGAFKSAKRFYRQARKNLLDPVSFSLEMGREAFVVGYCTGDSEMQQMAIEDSASGSYSDMIIHIWDSANHDDLTAFAKNVNDLVDRYETSSDQPGGRLKSFLPLLPALRDPKNPDHQRALQHFGKEPAWAILRWIWIQKYNLPPADAITLLGGDETGLFQEVFEKYLQNDVQGMLATINKYEKQNGVPYENFIMTGYLYRKLHGSSQTFSETDLRPAGAVSVRELVLQKKGQGVSQ